MPVDAKMTIACWIEAVETEDPEERADALRVHVRNIRSRAAELAGKGYQRWADAIYGTIMFVPSDAAVVAALDTDPDLLRWLLDRRVFVCGPTGFAVIASAAMLAASERVLAADIDALRGQALAAHRAAESAVDAVNVSSTHLQRFLQARRRELDALTQFTGAVAPLTDAAASPTPLPAVRRSDEVVVEHLAYCRVTCCRPSRMTNCPMWRCRWTVDHGQLNTAGGMSRRQRTVSDVCPGSHHGVVSGVPFSER